MLNDALDIFRKNRVQDIEGILPVRLASLWVDVREVLHDFWVLSNPWKDVLDAKLIIFRDYNRSELR